MLLQSMGLEVDFILEYYEFLLEAFSLETYKMRFLEMGLQGVIVDVVLGVAPRATAITDMTTLVLVTTMLEKLINRVETSIAEATVWMPLKAALVFRSRDIVSITFVAS
jgi:hypothetical protein